MYDDYLTKITVQMEGEKAYRNPDLTLQNFSEKVKIPSYLVSKIINSKTDLNFYNFVNKYRIEEVKEIPYRFWQGVSLRRRARFAVLLLLTNLINNSNSCGLCWNWLTT